ncbi:MAG: hypothetical protein AMXMBFR84_44960 [Candidatus Hydrogenedentota bacterium]
MKIVLAGGFLGAGKTTLLMEAAARLRQRGIPAGLITNDQVPDLVDTALLAQSGAPVREVAGSCFCCNFAAFQQAVKSLEDDGAQCVVAEPVGSCTDLTATIIQPMKKLFSSWSLAPLSVVADPERVRGILRDRQSPLHPDAAYILRLQLQEADRIVLNKADTLSRPDRQELTAMLAREFPQARIDVVSAWTGEGVDEWLDHILNEGNAGSHIAPVDYDRYANGEAVLGWLNALVNLRWVDGLEARWEDFAAGLFSAMQHELQATNSEIGHMKIWIDNTGGTLAANLTGLNNAVTVRTTGSLERLTATMIVNARAQIAPEGIEKTFRHALTTAAYSRVAATIQALHCIRPGRPVPTHRYESAIQ